MRLAPARLDQDGGIPEHDALEGLLLVDGQDALLAHVDGRMRDLLEALSALGVAEDDGAEALSIQVAVGLQHICAELGGDLGERRLAGITTSRARRSASTTLRAEVGEHLAHRALAGGDAAGQADEEEAPHRPALAASPAPRSVTERTPVLSWRKRLIARSRLSPRAAVVPRTPVSRGEPPHRRRGLAPRRGGTSGRRSLVEEAPQASRPVGPGLDVDLEGHGQLERATPSPRRRGPRGAASSPSAPRRAARRAPAGASGSGGRARPARGRHADHRDLDEIGGGALDGRIGRHALAEAAQIGVAAPQLREIAPAGRAASGR